MSDVFFTKEKWPSTRLYPLLTDVKYSFFEILLCFIFSMIVKAVLQIYTTKVTCALV